MTIEAMYLKRIGVQPREWTNLPAPEVPDPFGSRIDDPGPRAGRTIAAMRDADFLIPRAEGLPRGSSWCASDAELSLRIQQASAFRSAVHEMPSSYLGLVEQELADKLTLQDGAASGWDVFHGGVGLPDAGPITEAASLIGSYLFDRWPAREPFWTRIPRGTNSGAPSYGTSDVDKLFHALMAAQITDWDSALDVYAAHRSYFEALPAPHAITFSRTGPVAKPLAMYDWDGDRFARVATAKSVAPRRRAVFGVPAFINIALQGFANIVKYGMMRTPWTAHPNEISVFEDLALARRTVGDDAVIVSDDISGFDLSVRRNHQLAIARGIYSRYWPEQTVDLWANAQMLPILGGPLQRGDRAFLYGRRYGGVTTSGVITTTLDGTFINWARTVTAAAPALGLTIQGAWRAFLEGKWSARFWGDDTVMIVPPRFDFDKYATANEEIGFTTQPVPGATFLMKHYNLNRGYVTPLAARVLQQTMWNEHGGRTEEIELLGLYARTAGFDVHPLSAFVWGLITDSAITRKWKITDRLSVAQVLRDPGYKKRLTAGIAANRSIVAQWIARAERGSSVDANLVTWLSHTIGGDPEHDATLDVSRLATMNAGQAETMSQKLGQYLGTPVDARPSAPAWLAGYMRLTEEAEEDETVTRGETL